MQIKKGQNRIVLIFPIIGIVIKFPVIRFFKTTKIFCRNIKNRNWRWFKKNLTQPFDRDFQGFKAFLFLGIVSNWREFLFYYKTKNSFLQPTYFSLFGFLNIQKMGKLCQFSATDLWCQLHELTEGKVWEHCHHFANPKNFCFDDNKLRIFDYGDPRTQKIIRECGMKIFNEFNPEYNWEEEKKKLKTKEKSTQGTQKE